MQFSLALLLFFYTAARPSTIMRTESYPSPLLVRHVRVRRVAKKGMVGFQVRLTLVGWKGYNHLNSNELKVSQLQPSVYHPRIELIRCLSSKVTIGTVQNRVNLPFDLGIYVVAHLFRMGAFGTDITAESLWDEHIPPVQEYMLDLPFLRAAKNAGADLVDVPETLAPNPQAGHHGQANAPDFAPVPPSYALNANGFRLAFRLVCEKTGLDQIVEDVNPTDQGHTLRLSPYAIRRFSASALVEVLGPESESCMPGGVANGVRACRIHAERPASGRIHAKLRHSPDAEAQRYLGHKVGGRTIHEIYDQGRSLLVKIADAER